MNTHFHVIVLPRPTIDLPEFISKDRELAVFTYQEYTDKLVQHTNVTIAKRGFRVMTLSDGRKVLFQECNNIHCKPL